MEVLADVLPHLVCDNCKGYLSRGPVLLLNSGGYLCGRCKEPEEGATRITPYERLAKVMLFPCKYQYKGCQQRITFADNQSHEEGCSYGKYVCPIEGPSKCKWSGIQGDILEHCQQKHPDKVIRDPFKFVVSQADPTMRSYILSAFNVLFLLQTKVCVASKKMFCSVQLIGDAVQASIYNYTVENDVTKKRDVAPEALGVLTEDTSIVMDVNLQSYNNVLIYTTFTLTVHRKNTKNTTHDKCEKCECKTDLVHFDEGGILCRTCAPAKLPCKFSAKGCTYTDIGIKCIVHEKYLCAYSIKCWICQVDIIGVLLDLHYTRVHADDMHVDLLKITASNNIRYSIIKNSVGRVLCSYRRMNDTKLYVELFTPLLSDDLDMYQCKLDDTITTNTANVSRTLWCDWWLNIPRNVEGGGLQVYIDKIKN